MGYRIGDPAQGRDRGNPWENNTIEHMELNSAVPTVELRQPVPIGAVRRLSLGLLQEDKIDVTEYT